MTELPLASVERIMRNAGAERISINAIATMAEILEDYGTKLSKEAIELARHAKRKTVKKEDIKLAVRRMVYKKLSY